MPTNNETLVAIPLGVTNPDELRTFLVKLVVAIDVLIGFRGGETPLVTKEFLEEQLTITILPLPPYSQTLGAVYDQVEMQTMSNAVTSLTNKVNEMLT